MTDDGRRPAREPDDASLPAVLRRATADVILDKGLGSFSLREVARRAGVSHAAPGYHFGDARGLLTAVAIDGLETLHEAMAAAAAAAGDPRQRLTAIGRAYVGVAVELPAHCQVMWREDVVDGDDRRYQEAGQRCFAVLEATVEAIAAEYNPGLPVDDASKLCWSAMQGLVELRPKFDHLDAARDHAATALDPLIARFTALLVDGMVGASSLESDGRRVGAVGHGE